MEDWLLPLQQDRVDAAWDGFLTRYRRLIFATIRHYTHDYDDGMDLFAHVCERLRADDLRRLRARAEDPAPRAQYSTWLVAVVRHIVVDWYRHRDGRRRLSRLAEGLTPLRRRIFELVFFDQHSHVETFELISGHDAPELSFREFLVELRETYREVEKGRGRIMRELGPGPPLLPSEHDPSNPTEETERYEKLHQALAALPSQDRLAIELYLLEEVPAERVSQILGLPNAKAVYNRVYRALADLRTWLAKAGIRSGDL